MQQIRVGLIGGGQIAKAHMFAFSAAPLLFSSKNNAVQLNFVAELEEKLARAASERFGFKKWTTSWSELTRDDEVDLVDVATPTFLHKDPAIDALEHGKHVLCEKPLATNAKDAHDMYRAAKKAGVVSMVGFNYRRIPSVSLAKKMIEAGKLGTIYQMQCNFFEDWGAPPYPLTWRFKAQTAGAGALADLGSHAIDLSRYLIGEPSRVCALRETFIKQRTDPSSSRRGKVDVDDTTLCLMRYSGGAIATIGASWIAQGRKVALDFQINGSKGTLCFSLERPNELLYYSSEDSSTEQGFKTLYAGPNHPYGAALIFPIADYGMGYADSMVNEVYDLVNAIREGEPIAPTFFDGWKTSQVIDAILKSSEKDGWVTIA